MNNKADGTAMGKEISQKLMPKLRFPEFRDLDGWVMAHLGDLFTNRQESGMSDLPLLSLMDKEGIVPQENSNRKNNSSNDKSRYLRVVPGDIAYNTMRMWEGRSALVGIEGLVSPAYTVCRPKEKVCGQFFSYYFKTAEIIGLFRRYSQGLVKDTLNLKYDVFSKIPVFSPSISEQQKIADCLSSIDELIAVQTQKLDALKAHKKGLMQNLFPREGETIPRYRFPEFRDAPEWNYQRVSKISDSLDSRRIPITESERVHGDIPYYGASGIVDYVADYIFDDDLLCISEDGANLVARTSPVAFSISGKTWVNNHAHVLKFSHRATQVIVEEYINSIPLDDFLTGMAQPKLNKAMLDSIPIPLPTSDEQKLIASSIQTANGCIRCQTGTLEVLKAHKKGLMQQLFPREIESEKLEIRSEKL